MSHHRLAPRARLVLVVVVAASTAPLACARPAPSDARAEGDATGTAIAPSGVPALGRTTRLTSAALPTRSPPSANDDDRDAPADAELANAIRARIADDDTLSPDAKEVTVVVSGGLVTLRGAVKNSRERDTVRAHTARLAPSATVRDELEVSNP